MNTKSKGPKIPEIGKAPAQKAADGQGVTTSRNVMGNVQSSGGDLTGDHVIQGDTVAATASEEQAIADRNKKEVAEQKEAAKAASKAPVNDGSAGHYKIVAGPNNNFPLTINGMTRQMQIGQSYELSENDFEILTQARFKLEKTA